MGLVCVYVFLVFFSLFGFIWGFVYLFFCFLKKRKNGHEARWVGKGGSGRNWGRGTAQNILYGKPFFQLKTFITRINKCDPYSI